MRAWRFLAGNQPIQLTTSPGPVAGPGEVVLAVKAAGLCHTHYAYADRTLTHALAKIPITVGHQFTGVIAQVCEGVTRIEIGQRVGVPTAEGGPGRTTGGRSVSGRPARTSRPSSWSSTTCRSSARRSARTRTARPS